jgi:type II secretory pathway component PulJ
VEVAELETSVESLRRQMKQFDRDLSDAVDGFYRRRQSDKMRELREEDESKKPRIRTWKDLLNSPVLQGKEKTEE